jgi:BirA family biotin operon repressor/biotin-[acetyl-CoA-carboxylase] ligase
VNAPSPVETGTAAPAVGRLDWRPAELQDMFAALCPDGEVQVVASVESTNTRLLEACRTGAAPVNIARLLVAEDQTSGRGRQGHVWASTRGASLTFSLAWSVQAADLSGLSLAVGVALAEALDPGEAAAPRIALKWPNDLWLIDATGTSPLPGRKLGGILIETLQCGPQRFAIVGVGLNVLPVSVLEARSGVANLQEIDAGMDTPMALHRVVPALVKALREFDAAGFDAFESRYRQRDLLRGRVVEAGAWVGVVEGVARGGALRLRCADGERDIVAGDVSIRVQPTKQLHSDADPQIHESQDTC